jgi:hypothetical protein
MPHDTSAAAARVRLGEHAARLDDQISLLLALHYGREVDHVVTLLQEVLWNVSVQKRIRLLDEALQRTGLNTVVPYLTPSLTAVFGIRNLIAHGVTVGSTDEALTLYSVRRGERKSLTLTLDHLHWAVERAFICHQDYIPRIEGRMGDPHAWGVLWGFDER